MNPSAIEADDLEPRVPITERIVRFFAVPARLLGALFMPDKILPSVIRKGRYGAAMLTVTAAALGAALVIGQRVDMTSMVYQMYPDAPGQKPVPGQHPQAQGGNSSARADAEESQEPKSDREIDEEIVKQKSMVQVMTALAAGVGTPIMIVILGFGLFLLGKYVGGKPTFGGSMSVAAHAWLPAAVKYVVVLVTALHRATLTPFEMFMIAKPMTLRVPVAEPLGHLLAFDPFALWSLVICGLGLASAAQIGRVRAFLAVTVCFLLYQLLTSGAGGM